MRASLLVGVVVALGLFARMVCAQGLDSTALDRAWLDALATLMATDADRARSESASSDDPGCFGLGDLTPAERIVRARWLAGQWRGRPVTWTIDGTHARGLLGPPMPAMPTVCMRVERGEWRFAGFIPGA